MLLVNSSVEKIKQIKNIEHERNKGRDLAQWESHGNTHSAVRKPLGELLEEGFWLKENKSEASRKVFGIRLLEQKEEHASRGNSRW